jgi:hypothetical protein
VRYLGRLSDEEADRMVAAALARLAGRAGAFRLTTRLVLRLNGYDSASARARRKLVEAIERAVRGGRCELVDVIVKAARNGSRVRRVWLVRAG